MILVALVGAMFAHGEEKKEPDKLVSKYEVYRNGENVSYNYSTRLEECSNDNIHLLVWMVPDKSILNPNEDITFTVYYKNLSKETITVPRKEKLGIPIHYYGEESSGSSLGFRDILHTRPFSVKSGQLGSFKVIHKTPFPNDIGFLQIELDWGGIVPAPITLEVKPLKLKQQQSEQVAAPDG